VNLNNPNNLERVVLKLLNYILAIFRPPQPDPEKERIKEEVESIKAELDCAINQFNYVTDPAMIEYVAYKIKALEVRYNEALRKAKMYYKEEADINATMHSLSKRIS
jgi:hypothetical protein